MTMRVGAFERSSIGEGFYFLFCDHTTHRKFFRGTQSHGANIWLLVRNPYQSIQNNGDLC